MANREVFYPETKVKISDPFYVYICPNGHKEWCCIPLKECPECGSRLKGCVPVNEYQTELKDDILMDKKDAW